MSCDFENLIYKKINQPKTFTKSSKNNVMKIMKCNFCGNEFDSIRSTAKYCSNSCRTKANDQRREKERIEAEKAEELAKIAEQKRIAAEKRKIKKDKKAAELYEAKLLADIELEIQAYIDAFESEEKVKGINSIVDLLHVNAEAREKQQKKEDIRRRNMEIFTKIEEKMKEEKRIKSKGKALAEIIFALSNPGIELENESKKAKSFGALNSTQKPFNQLIPTNQQSGITELKSNEPPLPGGINGSIGMKVPGITTSSRQEIPAPPKNQSTIGSIADDILSTIHIF